jgi:hypothetical protein
MASINYTGIILQKDIYKERFMLEVLENCVIITDKLDTQRGRV